jgi:hypothetical protein
MLPEVLLVLLFHLEQSDAEFVRYFINDSNASPRRHAFVTLVVRECIGTQDQETQKRLGTAYERGSQHLI